MDEQVVAAFRRVEDDLTWGTKSELNASVRLLGFELGVQPRKPLERVEREQPVPAHLSR